MRFPLFPIALLAAPTAAQTTLHAVYGTADGTGHGNGTGMVAAFVGDVNSDGLDDWIVGIPQDDTVGTSSGMVRLHSGADASVLWSRMGAAALMNFGAALDGVGDLDADGIGDVIVATHNAVSPLGSAFVLSGADGSLLFTVFGNAPTLNWNISVTGAGDLNGDGHPDYAVGSPAADEVPANGDGNGSVRAFSGLDGSELFEVFGGGVIHGLGYRLDGAGDLNGDGFDDLLASALEVTFPGEAIGEVRALSGVDGAVLYTFSANTPIEWFGSAVAGPGDLTGDGRPDILVGVRRESSFDWRAGAVRVYSGATGALLYSLYGETAGAEFGTSVAGAGDVDADGTPDFVVGAPNASVGLTGNGSATVYSGRDHGLIYRLFENAPGDALGQAVAGGGELSGDDRCEVLLVAPGDDEDGSARGKVRVVTTASPDCTAVASYCTAAVNSTGAGTLLSFTGTTSVSANDLVLHAFPGPPDEFALFFFGPSQVALPFGNGLRCVGGSLRRLHDTRFADWGGAGRVFDILAPAGGVVAPGARWNFQLFYEDPGLGAGFNTSDALAIDFCP